MDVQMSEIITDILNAQCYVRKDAFANQYMHLHSICQVYGNKVCKY